MNDREERRETERVVRKVMRVVEKFDSIGKDEFSAINRKIIDYVHKNRGIPIDQVVSVMSKVMADLPKEYGLLDKEMRSWEAVIAYLYLKYLTELGVAQP
jgi:hypothetical protein